MPQKFFVGQEVWVKGVVEGQAEPDSDNEIGVRFKATTDYWAYINIADIDKVGPAPIAVGDTVTWGNGLVNYTIVFIDGACAFLKCCDGDEHTVYSVPDLRVVEPE